MIYIEDNGTPDADVGSQEMDMDNQDTFEEGDLNNESSIVQN